MGLIRGGLLFIVTSLLMFSLLPGNIFLTLGLSFDSEGVKSELISSTTKSILDESSLFDEIDSNLNIIQSSCEGESEFSMSTSQGVLLISCEIADQGTEAIVQEAVNRQFDQNFDKLINGKECTSFLCVTKILFSEDGKDTWFNFFYFALMISLILILIKLVLTVDKINFPIQLGFLIIISSLPFIVLDFILPYFENSILSPLTVLFSETYSVFIISATIGAIFLIFGFGFKFYKMGSNFSFKFEKIKDFFKKKSNKNLTSGK